MLTQGSSLTSHKLAVPRQGSSLYFAAVLSFSARFACKTERRGLLQAMGALGPFAGLVAAQLLRHLLLELRVSHIVDRVAILAHRLVEFGVGHQLLHHADRKWFRIRLRVLNGDVDL